MKLYLTSRASHVWFKDGKASEKDMEMIQGYVPDLITLLFTNHKGSSYSDNKE
jgi:hypothetical protein